MRKRWRVRSFSAGEAAAAADLARKLRLPPLVAALLVQRGLGDADSARAFLEPQLGDLHDPAELPGCTRAAERIVTAIRSAQPIVIYGDYDVDGITASAILYHLLTLAGANVSTYVPHRIEEGYGLNVEAVERIGKARRHEGTEARSEDEARRHEGTKARRGEEEDVAGGDCGSASDPSCLRAFVPSRLPLLISVDCGITAIEPAAVAKELGIDLIITDHHEFDPARLPEAYALVHPRLEGESGVRGPESGVGEEERAIVAEMPDVESLGPRPSAPGPSSTYPFGDLCGAGVAFKLAWQVARVLCGTERLPENYKLLMIDLLSLAALGTVADVVPLRGENRVLVKYGLGRIKHTRFVGLNALIDASGLRDEKIDAYHVGFVLGPRLNACGRMGHARDAVHLLTAAGADEAIDLARYLTRENENRRATERAIAAQATQMVIDAGYDGADQRAIVLGAAGWHAGVLGIVASRLVETFFRPVVMLNLDNGEAHGSARSVERVSIHAALEHCREHLATFGGHAMAAGLRLEAARVEAFRAALVEYVNGQLAAEDLVAELAVDIECAAEDLTLAVFEQVAALAPFGRDNPHPLFCVRNVVLDESALRIGQKKDHLRLHFRVGRGRMQAVGFGLGELAGELQRGVRVDLVFEPKLSTWQNRRRAELHVKDVRLAAGAARAMTNDEIRMTK